MVYWCCHCHRVRSCHDMDFVTPACFVFRFIINRDLSGASYSIGKKKLYGIHVISPIPTMRATFICPTYHLFFIFPHLTKSASFILIVQFLHFVTLLPSSGPRQLYLCLPPHCGCLFHPSAATCKRCIWLSFIKKKGKMSNL